MSYLALIVGFSLLGVAAYDAVVTTISTTSAGGPLTSRVGHGYWRVAHRLARGPTSHLLTAAGPAVLVITIGIWLLLLWLGWTLVFAADPSAVVASATHEPATWVERDYFAGFIAFTLGVGDYVPVGAPWQLLSVVATISGLGLTTAAITYLVPVVTAATQRGQQAATIAALGGDAYAIVRSAYHDGSVRYLEPVLLSTTDQLLLTAERYLTYPILHYFHPRSPETELRLQLAALSDALTLVEHGLAESVGRPHPASISGVRAAIDQLLDRAQITSTSDPTPLHLAPLREAGLEVVEEEIFARRIASSADQRGRLASYAAESKWKRPLVKTP